MGTRCAGESMLTAWERAIDYDPNAGLRDLSVEFGPSLNFASASGVYQDVVCNITCCAGDVGQGSVGRPSR